MYNTTYKFFKFRTSETITIEAIKRQYRKLALENHPDRGGDEEVMKAINDEFAKLRKRYYNVHESQSGATYRDDKQEAPDNVTAHFEEIIEQLLKMNGVGIEICGSFLWLDGNTYEYRKEIKALGFRWASKKRKWFLAPEGWKKMGRRELSMDEIRDSYGSQRVAAGRYVGRKKLTA